VGVPFTFEVSLSGVGKVRDLTPVYGSL
jgi:hypothetical protein